MSHQRWKRKSGSDSVAEGGAVVVEGRVNDRVRFGEPGRAGAPGTQRLFLAAFDVGKKAQCPTDLGDVGGALGAVHGGGGVEKGLSGRGVATERNTLNSRITIQSARVIRESEGVGCIF